MHMPGMARYARLGGEGVRASAPAQRQTTPQTNKQAKQRRPPRIPRGIHLPGARLPHRERGGCPPARTLAPAARAAARLRRYALRAC